MLSKLKLAKHQQHLAQLPKLAQSVADVETLYQTSAFRSTLLKYIAHAKKEIFITALYLEHDEAGEEILNALYTAKQQRPELAITVIVDWHRAQRGRIGVSTDATNADWYYHVAQQHPNIDVPIYGIPVNTREALGVLHLKGFIFDDTVIYSGASINNVYLHKLDKYRFDRYHIIHNVELANTMKQFIVSDMLQSNAIQRLDIKERVRCAEIKNDIRQFRFNLRTRDGYDICANTDNKQLAVTPLVGLGKKNILNKTISHLMAMTQEQLVICTPYFNLPAILVRQISHLLRNGKKVEIIIGDKTANDFYIPPEEPFKIIGALPYLYEINLRKFTRRFQRFIDSDQLIIRLWKDGDNTYHLKGMWVDDTWQLITGNNLNPRAWGLDLENAILFHDPNHELHDQRHKELVSIRQHTKMITHYQELESIKFYPIKVKRLIKRLRRIRVDRLISRIL